VAKVNLVVANPTATLKEAATIKIPPGQARVLSQQEPAVVAALMEAGCVVGTFIGDALSNPVNMVAKGARILSQSARPLASAGATPDKWASAGL
jgi:hypothetical protein